MKGIMYLRREREPETKSLGQLRQESPKRKFVVRFIKLVGGGD
jgi:hypothetical protein